MKWIKGCLWIFLVLILAGCSSLRVMEQGTSSDDDSKQSEHEVQGDVTVSESHSLTKASSKIFSTPSTTMSSSTTTESIVTTQEMKPTEVTSTALETYTIQAGDTLYSLARRFGTTVEAITSINNIADESIIEAGQVIRLPNGGDETPLPDVPTQASQTEVPSNEDSVDLQVVEESTQTDYASISNTDLSWWYQPGPPSSIAGDVASLLTAHNVYWQLPHGRPIVYLTIDEGYEYETNTTEILQVLRDKGVKATFFVTGSYVNANPSLISQMVAEGHQLGNHTIQHLRAANALDQGTDTFIQDVVGLNQQVPAMTKLHRPPEGGYSERSLQILDDLGYKTVFWSFAYRDWLTDDQPDPATAKQTILNNLHSGSILLLHAVSDTNVAILGEVIDGIHAAGYAIELLPE